MYRIGDLFAGVGGIALGFEQAGMKVVWANELDKHACVTYRKNFDHRLIEGNIQYITENIIDCDLSPIDILCAGFPCQAFSIAGYRKGFNDDRGNLFFEIMKLASHLQPSVIFLENVKNLKGHDKGNTFTVIKECLHEKNYHVHAEVLNTCEYSDIPQNRERIYIIAFRDKQAYKAFKFPEKVEFTKSIKDIFEKKVDESFYYMGSKYYLQLKKEMRNKDAIYQWRRVYVRENKSGVCPTLTANMGTGGHNVPLIIDHKDIRKLTPRECFRFQGFPDSYKLPENLPKSALYKQAGNSVSVPVINAIAKNIKKALESVNSTNVLKQTV